MLEINEFIVFSSTGVCQVTDIIKKAFSEGDEREYYILEPIYSSSSTIYIPTDNVHVHLRKIMSREAVNELLDRLAAIEIEWIVNDQERRNTSAEKIKTGGPDVLAGLIKMMLMRQAEQIANGKQLSASDTEIMRQAGQILYGEVAQVLGMTIEEAEELALEKFDLPEVTPDDVE